jgi:lipopolysaccharide transport system permease protein
LLSEGSSQASGLAASFVDDKGLLVVRPILLSRDISVRYRQTAIGVTWAVLRPLLARHVVFTVVFGPDRQVAFPRYPLSDFGFRCDAALAIFCQLTFRSQE